MVASHSDELNQEVIQDEVKRQVAEALKELGVDPEKIGTKETTFIERGGSGGRGGGPKKKRVIMTDEDHRRAEDKGITDKQYMAAKARRGA